MKYLVGIDIGTSGTKSVLFDTEGNAVVSCLEEYPMYQPKNGWAEQDPRDWWNAVCKSLKEITANVDPADICGVGMSGQMHGLVMLDENNEVLRNAILWCDGRTTEECREIEDRVGREKLLEITMNPALEGFTASKILWVKKHEPELYSRCKRILLPKDYIRFMLTGEFATEVSDASGMQLLDIANRRWSREVCEALDVDMSLLPKMYESPDVTGYVSEQAAALTGLQPGVPVAGGAGDNAAAAIGTGVCEAGKAFTTIGTSGVVFAHTTEPCMDPKGRIHTFCCAVPGEWHVMGVTQAAGLSLNWFRNNLAKEMSYRELDEACKDIPLGSENLIYLPYLMGERSPILDVSARGVFFGLSAIHNKFHMGRAVMEGVAFSLYDCLKVLEEVGADVDDMAVCGGGGKSALWRKMLADIFNTPVKRIASDEGPALGAAILAGCAAGVYADVREGCRIAVKTKDVTEPCASTHEEYLKFFRIYTSLYPALKDAFRTLGETSVSAR